MTKRLAPLTLEPHARIQGQQFSALLDAGVPRDTIVRERADTLYVVLDEPRADQIVSRIKDPDRYEDLVVRAILDKGLGAAHSSDEPLGSGRQNILGLTTLNLGEAIGELRSTPGVLSVVVATEEPEAAIRVCRQLKAGGCHL